MAYCSLERSIHEVPSLSVMIAAHVGRTAKRVLPKVDVKLDLRYSEHLTEDGVCQDFAHTSQRLGLTYRTGLRCTSPLAAGQFVDLYYGEVIDSEEADRRQADGGTMKDNYLFDLDKFEDQLDIERMPLLVVDGEYMSGPTRFMNHSCDPNCAQYAVSYNRNDPRRYNLAFFALEDIAAGQELTFDYTDSVDDEPEEDDIPSASSVAFLPVENGYGPESMSFHLNCICGIKACSIFCQLWRSSRVGPWLHIPSQPTISEVGKGLEPGIFESVRLPHGHQVPCMLVNYSSISYRAIDSTKSVGSSWWWANTSCTVCNDDTTAPQSFDFKIARSRTLLWRLSKL